MKLYHASSSVLPASDSVTTDGDDVGGKADGEEEGEVKVMEYLLWDRKAEGGFPGMFFSCLCVFCDVREEGK